MTLTELVAEAAARIAALPAPKNGQVRAVPDERTVRYYGTLGLLDKPIGWRGRTALYGSRHVAQIVAIKRMQALGRSLGEIQAIWPTLDREALQRMSGVAIEDTAPRAARPSFWRAAPVADAVADAVDDAASPPGDDPHGDDAAPTVEVRVALTPTITLAVAVEDGAALTADEVAAIRRAAQPLIHLLEGRRRR